MPEPTTTTTLPRSIHRRSLMKGAAWATPAIASVAVAPMAAASPVPDRGLDGWVQLQRQCNTWGPDFAFDGRGNYSSRGLWVFTTQNDMPASATITFWLESPDWTFTNGSQPGWSDLTRNPAIDGERPAPGYYAYTSTYTGAWTYYPQTILRPSRWEASSDPYFYADSIPGGCARVSAYATRTVIYSSTDQVRFTRGPVTV